MHFLLETNNFPSQSDLGSKIIGVGYGVGNSGKTDSGS